MAVAFRVPTEEALHELGLDEALEGRVEPLVHVVPQQQAQLADHHGDHHPPGGPSQAPTTTTLLCTSSPRHLQGRDDPAVQLGHHHLVEGHEDHEQHADEHQTPVLSHVGPQDLPEDRHVCVCKRPPLFFSPHAYG